MNNISTRIVSLLLLVVFASCSNDPTSPATELKGTLKGFVVVMDQDQQISSDASGVKVSAEGTSFSTTTNADGTWEIKDLPTGTYVFSFDKPGYGSIKKFSFSFVGGGTVYMDKIFLVKDATVRVTLTGVQAEPTRDTVINRGHGGYDTNTIRGWARINGTFSEPPVGPQRRGLVYLGTSSSVSDLSGKPTMEMETYANAPDTTFSLLVDAESLYRNGLAKGTTVYVIAYPLVKREGYYDPSIRQVVMSGPPPSPSQVISFVVP